DVEPRLRHGSAEPGRVGPQPVAQLGRALDELDRLEARRCDGWSDAVREEIRPGALAQQLDDLAATGDVAARRATHRLAERAGEDVDALGDLVQLRRSPPVRAYEPDGMGVVDHHQRTMAVGKVADPGEIGDVPVHRED